MASDKQNIAWVDMAKGLSIFLVVIMYCAASVGEDTGQIGFLHWTIAFAMPFRMPEFFVISGLFLAKVIARPWRSYADRRILHYAYFYVLWAIIHIVFKVALVGGDPAGAAAALALAIVEPYGVLWFIYMLAVFGFTAKVLHELHAPHWLVLAAAALLQMLSIHTGSYLIDQFAAYFVYFYAGYVFAPRLFQLADWGTDNAGKALAVLGVWAVVNAILVFSPGFAMHPVHIQMGWAALPGVHLLLALAGAAAICLGAALLTRVTWMDWLRWLGGHSLVIYVAFVLPMGIARTILLRLGIEEPNLVSLATMVVAISAPLVLWFIVQKIGFGKFLFERPSVIRLRDRDTTSVPAE